MPISTATVSALKTSIGRKLPRKCARKRLGRACDVSETTIVGRKSPRRGARARGVQASPQAEDEVSGGRSVCPFPPTRPRRRGHSCCRPQPWTQCGRRARRSTRP